MANDILKYTSKDFDSIKTDLMDSISSLTNTWTSREDGDPGIVLVKHMSAIGDMLSYNLDKQALECYGPTVTQRKNAAKLFELVGYKMHWYRSAVTTVTLTYYPRVDAYMSMFLKAVDAGESDISTVQDAYYEYRSTYYQLGSDIIYSALAVPPGSANPPSYLEGIREFISVASEGYISPSDVPADHSFEEIRESDAFQANAENFLRISKKMVDKYKDQTENKLGMHTYLEDNERQLDIYSNNYGNISYSLIPTSVSPGVESNGAYKSTFDLLPFTPSQQLAIQGNLKMVGFDISQLQDNRFYLPDFEVDEENIFILFNTDFDNPNPSTHPSITIYKTDNLLTEEDIKIENPTSNNKWDELKVFFQFGVDDFDYPYIELSSYWTSVLPETGSFRVYYFKTRGKYGNITKNYLKRIGTYNASNIVIENVDTNISQYKDGVMLSRPGYNPETARDAYINSLNYIMTFDSLVTFYDFERFTKRVSGITNALAIDRQRAKDLNIKLETECEKYTEDQLKSILGNVGDMTESDMRLALYNIRKVTNKKSENGIPDMPVLKGESLDPIEIDDGKYLAYTLNMYPIYGNFLDKQDIDDDEYIAKIAMSKENGVQLPYKLYKIIDDESVSDGYISDIWQAIDDAGFRRVHIVSVDPKTAFARIFEWKCCGTIHLTKAVSKEEADSILNTVVSALKTAFSADNVLFGQKITQMDVIQVVTEADSRIRYFDAGMGDKKVIVYQNGISDTSNYFNTEAYFNAESIMKYCEPESNEDLLRIDPTYIYD